MVLKYLTLVALLGLTSTSALRLEQSSVLSVSDDFGEDKVKKQQADPGKSSADKKPEAGESQDDEKTKKQNDLIKQIQASGDNESKIFDAMHEHWAGRDDKLKAEQEVLAKLPKCGRLKVPAESKPEAERDDEEKSQVNEANAKVAKCELNEEKKEEQKMGAEEWTAEMPDKYLKPKPSLLD